MCVRHTKIFLPIIQTFLYVYVQKGNSGKGISQNPQFLNSAIVSNLQELF